MTLPHPLIDLVSGCHLVVEKLGLDPEANSGDDQLILRLLVGAPEDSRVRQARLKFPVNKY